MKRFLLFGAVFNIIQITSSADNDTDPGLLWGNNNNNTTTVSEQYSSCGTLLGDGRYCMNYSHRDLTEPPDGTNITTILDLSYNKISTLDSRMFRDEKLLMILDLSNNEIVRININVFTNLRSLKKIRLGNNKYNCNSEVCALKAWLMANINKVEDLANVTCHTPEMYSGQRIDKMDVNINRLCRNGTYNGFEINTGTVFMIWIVVPILITCFTALYIIMNGNNRVGRSVRNFCTHCRLRSLIRDQPAPQPPAEEAEPVPGTSRDQMEMESVTDVSVDNVPPQSFSHT